MMLCFGTIKEISGGKAKVLDFERDLLSDWMPILFNFTNEDQIFYSLKVDQKVAFLEDEIGRGVILGQFYDKNTTAPNKTGVFAKIGDLEIQIDSGIFQVGDGLFLVRSDKAESVLGSLIDAINLHTHADPASGFTGVPENADDFLEIKSNLSTGSIRTTKIKGE